MSNAVYDNTQHPATLNESSAAELLQQALPWSKVVKAFSTNLAGELSKKANEKKGIVSFIAGNNKEALDIVRDIIQSAGLEPVIAGDLSVSRKLENERPGEIQAGKIFD